MKDIKGAGGNIYKAERTVLPDGIIKFDHIKYRCKCLLPLVGERVFIRFDGNSPFASYPISVYRDDHFLNLITTIKN